MSSSKKRGYSVILLCEIEVFTETGMSGELKGPF